MGESGLSSLSWGHYVAPVESYPLEFSWSVSKQMVTGLLRNVVAEERDPAAADRMNMMGRKRRLQIQLYYVVALICRRRVSLVVRRVVSVPSPRHGNSCGECLTRGFRRDSQWMLQVPLPSTRTDSPARESRRLSGVRTSENVELAVLQSYL